MEKFRELFEQRFALAELQPNALVTFGITATTVSTAYGYGALWQKLEANDSVG